MLTLHPVGVGAAVFAPWQLWNTWRADHFGFSTFHSDLLMRGAGVAVLTAPAFVPAPGPTMGGGAPLAPEIVNYPTTIALINHQPPPVQLAPAQPEVTTRSSAQMPPSTTPDSAPPDTTEAAPPPWQHTAVRTANASDFLWSEAINVYLPPNNEGNAGAELPLAIGRPAPVTVGAGPDSSYPTGAPGEDSTSTPYVTLHVAVKAGQTKVLRLLPIRVQNPATKTLTATAVRYDAQGIRLLAWPNSANVMPKGDTYKVPVAPEGAARLTVYNSPDSAENYRVLPGSRHRVTITDLAAVPVAPPVINRKSTGKKEPAAAPKKPAPSVRILTADAQGRLTIEARGATLLVDIEPVG
jgi:hypothetical protein